MQSRPAGLSLIAATCLLIVVGCDYREGLKCARDQDCLGLVCNTGVCAPVNSGATGSSGSQPLLKVGSTAILVHADAQHIYWRQNNPLDPSLEQAPISSSAVSATFENVGDPSLSLVVTKNSAMDVLVFASGRITRWTQRARSSTPEAAWSAAGGLAVNGEQVYWVRRDTADGTLRLVKSDRNGVVTETFGQLQLQQTRYPPIKGTSAGVCLSEDGGEPTFVPWVGGAISLGGTGFELSSANATHCVWTSRFTNGKTSLIILEPNQDTTRLSVSIDVRSVVLVSGRLILLERDSGRLLTARLTDPTVVSPRLPGATSLKFTSLVGSDGRAFALSGGDVYEVVP